MRMKVSLIVKPDFSKIDYGSELESEDDSSTDSDCTDSEDED